MLEFSEFYLQKKNNIKPKQLVILLHGYGSNKNNILDTIAPQIAKYLPNAYFISPNAHQTFESTNAIETNTTNSKQYQWFSLNNKSQEEILKGAKTANKILEPFILKQAQRLKININKTIIIGFSQGGMMALHTGLNMKKKPKILLSYSGLLIQNPIKNSNYSKKKNNQEIILVHGKKDKIIPIESMHRSAILLLKSNNIKLHILICKDLEHEINIEGINFAGKILNSIFN